jgi:hypothetical protein
VRRWATEHRFVLDLAVVALFSLGLCVAAVQISKAHFLRDRFGPGRGELPVMSKDVTEAMSFLRAHVRPGDVVLAERQTILFVELTTGRGPAPVADTISRVGFGGFDLYYVHLDYDFFFDSRERIDASIERLLSQVDARGDSKIWIISIGWQQIRDAIGREICGPPMTDAWSQGGASVYGFRASSIVGEISPDPVDTSRSETTGGGTRR